MGKNQEGVGTDRPPPSPLDIVSSLGYNHSTKMRFLSTCGLKALSVSAWLVVVMLSAVPCAGSILPYEGSLIWERDFIYARPADLDGDSLDEFVAITQASGMQSSNVVDQTLRPILGNEFFPDSTFRAGLDFPGGLDTGRLWMTLRRRDSLFVHDFGRKRDLFVVRVTSATRQLPLYDGLCKVAHLMDIDADGHLEALVSVVGWRAGNPRGLYVLDWDSGNLKWKYPTGPQLTSVVPRDIDGDGKSELLCGTFACFNGNSANGTDDYYSYVFLLNSDSSVRWVRQIGVYSSCAWPLWLDDRRVLVCEDGSPAGGRSCDSLYVLSAEDGRPLHSRRYGVFNSGQAILRGAQGQPMIVVAGSDDTLRVLDEKLRLLNRRALHCGGVIPNNQTGILPISGGMILVATADGQVQLYDRRLKLLGAQEARFAEWYPVRARTAPRFLTRVHTDEGWTWRLYEFTLVPLLSRSVSLKFAAGSVLVLLLAFGITLVSVRYRQTQDIRSVIRSLTGRAGTIELNRRGEVTSTNQKARELLGTREKRVSQIPTQGPFGPVSELARAMLAEPEGTPPRELAVSIAPGQTSMVRCVRVKTGAVLTIEDITAVEYQKRLMAWAPVAQKLAHGIKNPLNTILGSVEQIELKVTDEKALNYMGYVKDEVTRLRKMSDAFMRFTKLNPPALEPKNVNEVIKKVTAKYECRMTNRANRQDAKEDGFNTKTPRHEEESGMNRQESGLATKAQRHEEESGMNRQDAKNAKGIESGVNTKAQRHEVESGMNRQESGLATKARRHEVESGAAGIELRLELDEKLPAIALDEEGLSNALEIVIENAVEALESMKPQMNADEHRREETKKTLTIRTSQGTPSSSASSVRSVPSVVNPDKPGVLGVLGGETRDFIRIEIADTGKGISEKYLDKVFEPYFTMGKPQGTGLGLALAKKIIEDHKGKVEIESHEGIGTRVSIFLPIKS